MRRKFSYCLVAFALAALFAVPAQAQLAPYSQDFEGLDPADPEALGNVGWKVFGNVFDPSGTIYYYGYGPFDAPNPGVCPPGQTEPCPGFSAVVTGEGGPDQGAQQLNVYSDYNSPEHEFGNLIESNVFQEQVVPPASVGQTWIFSFDAKRGDIGGSTTAVAFIKTIDPNNNYALTNFLTIDTTDLPDGWSSYEIPITIDPGLPGQFLQFGFLNKATNDEPSGVFYDNVNFGQAPPIPCEPDPATQGYWHRQCLGVPASEGGIDPGRNGRGPGAPTEPGFVDELMPCAFERLEAAGLFGLMTCDGMDADPASDPCQRAEKQLTALILNACSGRVQNTCSVDLSAQGCLSTDLDGLIVELAGYIQAGSCKQAAECAAAVNEGYGLFDGAEPATIEPAAATRERLEGKGRGRLGGR